MVGGNPRKRPPAKRPISEQTRPRKDSHFRETTHRENVVAKVHFRLKTGTVLTCPETEPTVFSAIHPPLLERGYTNLDAEQFKCVSTIYDVILSVK